MKNLLLVLSLLFSFGLQAQEELIVPETQMPVITKIAATWCPPCGEWGWTFFGHLLEDNSEKAVIFAAHHSGDLINEVASAFTTNYGVSSQPRFVLDGIDQAINSSNAADKRIAIKDWIEAKSIESPIVQVGLDANYLETELRINYKTKFFQSTSGEYTVGIYLVEKEVIANQASIGPEAEHENILRKSLVGDDFGALLGSGDIASGETTEGFIALPLGDWDTENIEIIAIIWQKINGKYEVVNANKDSEIELFVPVGTEFNSMLASSFSIQPNLVQTTAKIIFSLPVSLENANISLLDVQGKEVAILHQGVLPKGENSFTFNRTNNLPAGVYVIRLTAGGKVLSRKIILE